MSTTHFQPFPTGQYCADLFNVGCIHMYYCLAAGCTTYYVPPKACSCQYLCTLTTQAIQLLPETTPSTYVSCHESSKEEGQGKENAQGKREDPIKNKKRGWTCKLVNRCM